MADGRAADKRRSGSLIDGKDEHCPYSKSSKAAAKREATTGVREAIARTAGAPNGTMPKTAVAVAKRVCGSRTAARGPDATQRSRSGHVATAMTVAHDSAGINRHSNQRHTAARVITKIVRATVGMPFKRCISASKIFGTTGSGS
jgi:hypothetical protein